MKHIVIEHARTHNLKNISLRIPRNKLVVVTGVSGSGKSSLVFDTLYAEAQRRYLESLNSYGSQFLGALDKPDVQHISGLSPAIAIHQKTTSNSPRSTVGTMTEITDYLRVLFARCGQASCVACNTPIRAQSPQAMLNSLNKAPEGTKLQLLAPIVRGRKGDYGALFQQLRKEGFQRVRVDGEMLLLDELPESYKLDRYRNHTIDVVMDRIVLKPADLTQQRLAKALQDCLKRSNGLVNVLLQEPTSDTEKERRLSQHLACPTCDASYGELAPRLFSFNSPYGACTTCEGLGSLSQLNWQLCVPNSELTLQEGGFQPLLKVMGKHLHLFAGSLAKALDLPLKKPLNAWSPQEQALLLYGKPTDENTQETKATLNPEDDSAETFFAMATEAFPGMEAVLKHKLKHAHPASKRSLNAFFHEVTCPACKGARLQPFSLSVKLGTFNFESLHQLSIKQASQQLSAFMAEMDEALQPVAKAPLQEILNRLDFLMNVGLEYLQLGRSAQTLSGGENQRIRLASQIGSMLSGVLYVLDEPSIGLHPHNTLQLIETLKNLQANNNSLIVVEHDEMIIKSADHLIDIGPAAGERGGYIVSEGSPETMMQENQTLTSQYMSGQLNVELPTKRKRKTKQVPLQVVNAHKNNLQALSLNIPTGQLVCFTGPSGSGKSTLLFDCVLPYLQHHLNPQTIAKPEGIEAVEGLELLERVIDINQSPIGRSSRSNPATYMGLFDAIRTIFSGTEAARIKGMSPSHFSFNVKGGRCEHCQGDGYITLELGVLDSMSQECPYCEGKRFNQEVLAVTFNGKNIAEVLSLEVEEACLFFEDYPKLAKQLEQLNNIGLGYLKLGQATSTLSGGEKQRLKLASELQKSQKGNTLYLFDEPTVGLHWGDVQKLLNIMNSLVEQGNTCLVIEHNLDVIKNADTVIELGPGGGEHGGRLVYNGSFEGIKACSESLTRQYL